MPYIRIRNITGVDIVVVPGIQAVPKYSTITTYIMRTSELERVQSVLSDLRRRKKVEYIVYDQENGVLDNSLELATVQDVHDAISGQGGTSGGSSTRLYQIPLIGVINGVNTIFSTAAYFIAFGAGRETVYLNGVAQLRGEGNDYVATESVPAAGYDLILLAAPPRVDDSVTIDYTEA